MASEKDLDGVVELERTATDKGAVVVEADDAGYVRRSKSIVRKLDMTLMPMVWILYMFNYLDRNNISQAKLDTFTQDLHMTGDNFNTAVSILNVGYIIMQLPSNMLITRVRPSLFIPTFVCLWSVISTCTSLADNYQHLIVIRFFLGFVEAPFFPGVFFLLSCWYTRRELAFRAAILYSGLVLATAFSGLIAAGVLAGLKGVHGLAGWRWLFIVDGAASFGCGLVAFFLLPDFPETKTGSARWLFSAEEMATAVERMRRDRVSVEEGSRSVWFGLKLAVTDRRTWAFVVLLLAQHTAYGFNSFYPSIVQGFGLGSTTVTLVLTTPPYLVATCVCLAVAWSSDRRGERGWHVAAPMAVAAVGYVVSSATLNVPARYLASFLYISGCFAANAGSFSWASTTLNQTPEKRAAAVALINLLAQLGNVWSPYFFRPQDANRYLLAMILMLVFSLMAVAAAGVLKADLKRANRRLEREFEGLDRMPTLFTE